MLTNAEKENFATLQRAFENGDVALMEVTLAATGERRAALVAIHREKGEYAISPFAVMVWDDPFKLLNPPLPMANA